MSNIPAVTVATAAKMNGQSWLETRQLYDGRSRILFVKGEVGCVVCVCVCERAQLKRPSGKMCCEAA